MAGGKMYHKGGTDARDRKSGHIFMFYKFDAKCTRVPPSCSVDMVLLKPLQSRVAKCQFFTRSKTFKLNLPPRKARESSTFSALRLTKTNVRHIHGISQVCCKASFAYESFGLKEVSPDGDTLWSDQHEYQQHHHHSAYVVNQIQRHFWLR